MAKKPCLKNDPCRQAHVEALLKISEKRLTKLALKARKEVEKARGIVAKHREEIKKAQAKYQIVEAVLEDITLARLKKAAPRIQRQNRDLEEAKKVSPELLRSTITI